MREWRRLTGRDEQAVNRQAGLMTAHHIRRRVESLRERDNGNNGVSQ